MEYIVISSFIAILLTSVFLNISLLYPLFLGFFLFFGYGLKKGFSAKELLVVSWEKVRSIGSILIVFALIGSLTAVWRASGTIAVIIQNTSSFLHPSYFVLITFFLCACLSMLIGTAYGTAATIGVICMSIGRVFGIDPAYLGGAILAGSYFGDRMSPMSTTVFLVSMVTKTDIYTNVKRMAKTTTVPILLSCLMYLYLGQSAKISEIDLHALDIFNESFNLHWLTILPALVIILLAFFRVNVRNIMAVSTAIGALVCIFVQAVPVNELIKILFYGFSSDNKVLDDLLHGGGVFSMVNVAIIVGLSSSYAALFEKTKMLEDIKDKILHLSEKIGAFPVMVLTAIVTAAVSCNQILSVMLTTDLCKVNYEKLDDMTIPLENSAMVIPPLIPWSITCGVPFASVGAPTSSLYYASFLYFIVLWALVLNAKQRYSSKRLSV